ncbi:hypothetical protein EOD41_16015 [Mucilaginibacter limnophilus]|uniref:Uncharacterized protein n=1 Tax=Mucilaginibacter limnophilus TaxID=1932778 RepID=A0A437MQM1_9SPHI|nr:hypothetical protein [Mucilaginibacter limnophilus]RVT99943.1 hypothetical protein EOD41_16015 [Mucilaginibacter limnophilus]
MNKQMERLKKQLAEISEVVNTFKSEAVQVKIAEKLFDVLIDIERADSDGNEVFKRGRRLRPDEAFTGVQQRKKPGATRVLNQLLNTDFFDVPRSISSIASYCKEHFDSDFKTSELSGILLKLSNENKLRREKSKDNNRFDYIKP